MLETSLQVSDTSLKWNHIKVQAFRAFFKGRLSKEILISEIYLWYAGPSRFNLWRSREHGIDAALRSRYLNLCVKMVSLVIWWHFLNNASSTSSRQEIRFLCSWVRSNQWISTTRWRESLYTSLRASLTKEFVLRLKISYLNILVSSIPVVPRRKIVLEQPHCTVYMAVDHC